MTANSGADQSTLLGWKIAEEYANLDLEGSQLDVDKVVELVNQLTDLYIERSLSNVSNAPVSTRQVSDRSSGTPSGVAEIETVS